MKAVFLDVDGTLTETLSGATFKQNPQDIKVIDGVLHTLDFYQACGFSYFFGISNQGGIAVSKKTIQDTIQEMRNTFSLIWHLESISFCPDFEGEQLYTVNSRDVEYTRNDGNYDSFRKPGCGMIQKILQEYTDIDHAIMIGDREEDKSCAFAANIPFIHASDFHKGSILYTYPDMNI